MQDVFVFDDVVAQPDALVADEDRRPGNELAHLVLRLTAERAIERVVRLRNGRRGGEKRACVGRTRSSRLDLGRQDIPILVANALAISSRHSLWVVSTAL